MTEPELQLPFVSLEYPDAVARAKAEGKLLLIDATAQWCGPCRIMERTTWSNDDVRAWIGEHAIAIKVDVDEQTALAQHFRIQSMPTVVAMRDGNEIDRINGLRQPAPFLAWLGGLLEGRTILDTLVERVNEDPHDVQARVDLAFKLYEAQRWDGAGEQLMWLWQHMVEHQPAAVGVRQTRILDAIEQLTNEHAASREAFVRLRDEHESALLAGDRSPSHIMDFISLNHALDDAERTLAWLDDSGRDCIELAADDRRVFSILAARVMPLFEANGRWGDICRIYGDPVARLREHHQALDQALTQMTQGPMKAEAERMGAQMRDYLRHETAGMLRAFAQAERGPDVDRLAAELRSLLPGEETDALLATFESPPGA